MLIDGQFDRSDFDEILARNVPPERAGVVAVVDRESIFVCGPSDGQLAELMLDVVRWAFDRAG